jgi:hypothetical protein
MTRLNPVVEVEQVKQMMKMDIYERTGLWRTNKREPGIVYLSEAVHQRWRLEEDWSWQRAASGRTDGQCLALLPERWLLKVQHKGVHLLEDQPHTFDLSFFSSLSLRTPCSTSHCCEAFSFPYFFFPSFLPSPIPRLKHFAHAELLNQAT